MSPHPSTCTSNWTPSGKPKSKGDACDIDSFSSATELTAVLSGLDGLTSWKPSTVTALAYSMVVKLPTAFTYNIRLLVSWPGCEAAEAIVKGCACIPSQKSPRTLKRTWCPAPWISIRVIFPGSGVNVAFSFSHLRTCHPLDSRWRQTAEKMY